MAGESNLIQFKRGTMAALEALIQAGTGEDGTFYLTVDDDASGSNNPSKSSRLFVGRADGSIVPVNQGIITVTTVSELTNGVNGKWHAGDYAYVTGTAAQNYADGNILAIYDGANWKQINAVGSDTYVTDFSADASTSNGVTTVTSTVTDNFNGSSRNLTADVQFEGANGVQISSTAASYGQTTTPAKVTITGDSYSLGRTGDAQNNQAEVSLTSANTNNDTSIVIQGGNNLTVSTSGTNVVELESTDFGINSVSLNAESTGFTVSTMQNNGSSSERTSSVLDPTIVLGTNTSSPVHFANGVATLPVYTKDEIDAQKKALDAMKYRGTIGSNGTVASSFAEFANSTVLPVSVGDTFKVVGSSGLSLPAEISATGAAVDLKEGDIVIARGTEGTDGNIPYASLLFDVIPSGNEIDTTYSLTGIEHGVTLSGSTTSAADSGSFALAAGTQIALTDSSPAGITKQITVSHGEITTDTNPTPLPKDQYTGQEPGTALTIPVIKTITVNNGHVTGWTIQNYEVIDTSFELTGVDTSASAANNVATVTSTVSYRDQTGSARNDVDTSFTVSSDNLNVTATNATSSTAADVKVNFVWGTFSAN